MDKINRVVKRLDSISEWTGRTFSWAIVILTFLVALEVVMRRVFNSPTIWNFEITKQLYGLHFMILAAYALLYKAHVSIDIISKKFSPRKRAVIDIITYSTFFFPFCFIILWYGSKFAWTSWSVWERSWSVFAPPLYPIKTMIPVTSLLLILQGTSEFIKRIWIAVKGREL